MGELIDNFFANINILMPVLPRPTFEQGLRSSLHLRDRSFGSIALLACALGSRFSHDRRVLMSGDDTWLSAGWKWFMQTRVFDDAAILSPTSHLHVLQSTCVRVHFDAPPIDLTLIHQSWQRYTCRVFHISTRGCISVSVYD